MSRGPRPRTVEDDLEVWEVGPGAQERIQERLLDDGHACLRVAEERLEMRLQISRGPYHGRRTRLKEHLGLRRVVMSWPEAHRQPHDRRLHDVVHAARERTADVRGVATGVQLGQDADPIDENDIDAVQVGFDARCAGRAPTTA